MIRLGFHSVKRQACTVGRMGQAQSNKVKQLELASKTGVLSLENLKLTKIPNEVCIPSLLCVGFIG